MKFTPIPPYVSMHRNVVTMETKQELMQIVSELDNTNDVEQLFDELLTPKEKEDLYLRWQLLKELHAGTPQRTIAKRHKISLCKITRGSKLLKAKSSITLQLLNKYYKRET